jgi:iron complex outermembrane receptor protein
LSAIVPVNGANQTITTNAGKASVLGWEFEAQFTPVHNFNLTTGIDLTDGHYRQFCPSGLDSSGNCTVNSSGQLANYAGQKLDRTPSRVIYVNASYLVPVGEGDVQLNVGTRLSTAYSVTVFGDNGPYWLKLWTPAQTKTQASVTYNAPGHRWYLSAYIKNIETMSRWSLAAPVRSPCPIRAPSACARASITNPYGQPRRWRRGCPFFPSGDKQCEQDLVPWPR